MSDDQDGCEWMNVSSGTSLPRVVPDKRLLNGCVCVCVCVVRTMLLPSPNPIICCSINQLKSRMVFLFWSWLTTAVLKNKTLNAHTHTTV